MVFTAPDTSTVTVKGLHTKHYLGIDEEGAAVNSKTAYVSVSEQLFIDAGFSIRDAEGEVNLDAYKVAVADSTGSTFNYRIAQYFPDETIGLIVCFYKIMPINGIIPAQNFKVVRDKIGDILAIEFANQFTLTSDPDYNLRTSIGRSTPIDHSEMPFINVLTGAMSLDNQNQGASDNTVTYYIDFYVKAKSTNDNLADINAETILLKLVGTGRAILENPIYKTLDFAAGTIMNRHVSNIDVRDPQNLKEFGCHYERPVNFRG